MTSVRFAHITDIHLSEEDTWGTLGGRAGDIFRETVRYFNHLESLDFVLITGDILNNATPGEVTLARDILSTLNKPWHFVPGNHDGFIDPKLPNAYAPHEALPLFDPRLADPVPYVQHVYWNRAITPGVRLIGLDSRVGDDWAGEVSAKQIAWLDAELTACPDDLVIVAVHHPLHDLGPHNSVPPFEKFIVSNGREVEAVLDRHPQVRLVLAGHHHIQKLDHRANRLHINTAALTGYPCLYRMVEMQSADAGWHIRVDSFAAAEPDVVEEARQAALGSNLMQKHMPGGIECWTDLCEGTSIDQGFDGILS